LKRLFKYFTLKNKIKKPQQHNSEAKMLVAFFLSLSHANIIYGNLFSSIQ